MFKLKFFILFVLAGLCFSYASPMETSSRNGEGEGNLPGAAKTAEGGDTSGTGKRVPPLEKEGEASPSGTGDSESEQKEESTDAKGNHPLGYNLPTFIGDLEERRKYATTLQSTCSTQHQEYKINREKNKFTQPAHTLVLGLVFDHKIKISEFRKA
uniref:Putative ixodes 8-cys protein n=1 Tax=Ixodes ricinus TaxID=34613 RepID=A0A0K8R9H9_IXORI